MLVARLLPLDKSIQIVCNMQNSSFLDFKNKKIAMQRTSGVISSGVEHGITLCAVLQSLSFKPGRLRVHVGSGESLRPPSPRNRRPAIPFIKCHSE